MIHLPRYNDRQYTYLSSIIAACSSPGVLSSISILVMLLGLWSFFIAVLFLKFNIQLQMEDKMIPMLGLSIAMLLAFRTNRGFERYWLGAQQWTSLSSQLRHLSRIIHNGCHTPTPLSILEKKATMKLLYGVAVSVKHALRGIDAFTNQEFLDLLPGHLACLLRRTGKLGDDLVVSYKLSLVTVDEFSKEECAKSRSGLKNRKKIVDSGSEEEEEMENVLRHSVSKKRNSQNAKRISTCNAPFDVIHRISFYLRRQREESRMDVEDVRSVIKAVETIIDAITKFEQILYIPVPKSYDIHMKQVLVLYFLAIPFQLVKPLGYSVVIVTMLIGFAMFGADAIAGQIEDPFGNDEYDLPLEYFCQQLKEDIEYIMEAPGFLSSTL